MSAHRICVLLLTQAPLLQAVQLARSEATPVKARSVEEEYALYRKYWGPFEPPPHHHPGIVPNSTELHDLMGCETKYNNYWRSLPMLQPSSALQDVQAKPYLKDRSWRTRANMTTVPAPKGQHIPQLDFILHHKTGENLHTNIKMVLSPEGPSAFKVTDLYEPSKLKVVPGSRRIHMVRDPVDAILSGYRYHRNVWGPEMWSWGHKKLQDPQCFECDDEDHDIIFESCHSNCTYFELLNRLDEVSGAVTEAVSARKTVTSMSEVMSLLKEDNMTLHLSFDLFRANYTKTSECLLRFLGLNTDPQRLIRMIMSVTTVRNPVHVTSGLYNSFTAETYLRSHPHWGPDFEEISGLMRKVFQRQAKLWGCPAAEAV